MEKHTAHYHLSVVKAEVLRLGAKAFTRSALEGGRRLGLSLGQMQPIVCTLETAMFYKSMTSYADGMKPVSHRSEIIDYKHLSRPVHELAGWECQVCAEVEFDADSADRYAAGDQLIEDCRQLIAAEMKRIRRKLHLSQKEAVQLLSGGGHNAFSRYERGDVAPPQPLLMLMRLLIATLTCWRMPAN